MSITLDHENYAENPWTLTAEQEGQIIAAVCDKFLENAQFKLDCLLIELGHKVYEIQTEDDGFVIY